ncbi:MULTISPECIES: DASS family sodium-coupled anion symporter [Lactobacillus]|uniref:DASS family sodium-coupled anion symporter n=1 Tax=Lactobacillus panisapium TaxID=2012495 RepID=A0ABX8WAR2_9LACO|nr:MULTISPECIES: DASS family sodium-coupled anion symporter [Lactobacillus]MCO6532829.1 DASS family sodium-coupled anion symporter [Lactobacillus sp.]MCT6820598.1 anion permease [Lactobacillus panisapium]MCT6853629.1 anion permease [Lactobacillus panisapium]MCX8721021.1 DASS family sodium-coupled anion symporter [Lactobacillus sp. B4010]MCX8722875.1 DASS family sodium-coupled anion symporter [Lactobacillus sp. B4005]
MKTLEKVNYKGFVLPVIIGIALWCFTPIRPYGLSAQAWEMFAIFVATIVGCITKPLPIGGTTLIGLIVTVLVGLAPIQNEVNPKTGAVNAGILSAFSNSASWLIAMAFIMAYGISKTGLGNRIAYWMIRRFGKRSIGIGYAITGLELILGALIPSNSARTGGVVWPVTESISKDYDSLPNDPSRKKIGAYLSFIAFHANVISTALFITGAAPNMVASQMAIQKGYQMSWISWFTAAIVPAIIATIVIPLIIYKIFPPEIKETPNAKKWADDRLADMGPVTKPEKIMSAVFLLAIVLWVLSGIYKIPQLDSTFVAFLAVGLLLLTGVLTMQDALKQTGAWNILIWLSILVFMASKLISFGFIDWFSKTIQSGLHGISWEIVLAVLVILMFYTHYFFASGTAHMTALYLPFLSVAVATGAPLALSAMLLAFTGAINASTTHYANGPASILATTGYIKQSEWWKMNFILGIVYLLIFGVIGTFWMKIIGMW